MSIELLVNLKKAEEAAKLIMRTWNPTDRDGQEMISLYSSHAIEVFKEVHGGHKILSMSRVLEQRVGGNTYIDLVRFSLFCETCQVASVHWPKLVEMRRG